MKRISRKLLVVYFSVVVVITVVFVFQSIYKVSISAKNEQKQEDERNLHIVVFSYENDEKSSEFMNELKSVEKNYNAVCEFVQPGKNELFDYARFVFADGVILFDFNAGSLAHKYEDKDFLIENVHGEKIPFVVIGYDFEEAIARFMEKSIGKEKIVFVPEYVSEKNRKYLNEQEDMKLFVVSELNDYDEQFRSVLNLMKNGDKKSVLCLSSKDALIASQLCLDLNVSDNYEINSLFEDKIIVENLAKGLINCFASGNTAEYADTSMEMLMFMRKLYDEGKINRPIKIIYPELSMVKNVEVK